MLVGSIKYKREDNGKWEVFQIKGVDTSSSFQSVISTYQYSGVDLMEGEEDSDGLSSRRFNVGMSNVKVQTHKIWSEEKQKDIPKPINMDFFLQIGAVIRYAKSHCYKRNAINYTGIQIATGDYSPETETTYRIPIDRKSIPVLSDGLEPALDLNNEPITVLEEQKYLGEVVLNLGEIRALRLSTDRIIIDIEENPDIPMEQMYDFKVNKISAFRFDTAHLTFHVEPPKVEKVKSGDAFGLYGTLEEIIKNNPERDFEWLLGREYIIVDDDNVDEIVQKFLDHDGYVFYDTETTGLNINFLSRLGQADQAVGIVLSMFDGVSYYFPLQHKCIKNLCNGDHAFFMERYMRKILETKQLVAHNMSFDWKVSYIYDINANIVHDTMAMFKLTYGAEKEDFRVGLKELTRMFLNRDSLELSDMVVDDSWGESDIKFWDLPYELVRLYAPADTDNTLGLFNYAVNIDLLHKYNAQRIYNIEITFSLAVAYQEFYGHKVDTDHIEILKTQVEEGMEEYRQKMFDLVGYEFNPNSPDQLKRIMYEELGIPKKYSRKTGNLSTDKNTLKELAELTDIEGKTMYPFVKYLQKYREWEGINKNFIKNLSELATADGFLFSDVQQYGTTTGRVSIKKPNYQSYNDAVKKYIVPRRGFYMSDNDYSSVEYRVLGSMAEQGELIKAFYDPELDYHSYQASRMFNVPYEAVTSKLRKSAKGINFGLPYGMGDKSLGVAIFGEESPENTRKAGVLRKKYFVGQEKIQDFFEKHRDKGVRDGFTETHYGRRRYYHKNKFSESAIRRQAGNQVIQGTAADLYKMAVGRLFLRVCQEGWLGKVLFSGFIHDELLCEVHESIDPMIWLKAVRECFEMKIEGFCPLYVGFGYGMSWYQAKKTEIPTKLQIELETEWGTTGYPAWKELSSKDFCDSIPVMIRDYQIRAVIESITDVENQGKTIKPMINTYLTDTLSEDKGIIKETYIKHLKNVLPEDEATKVKDLDIGELYKKVESSNLVELVRDDLIKGNIRYVADDFDSSKDLQSHLDEFCKLHDVDRSSVNLISTSSAPQEQGNSLEVEGDVPEVRGYDFDLEDPQTAEEKQKLKDFRIDEYGLYADFNCGEVTFLMLRDMSFMKTIQGYLNRERRGLRVYLKDKESKKIYETPSYIEDKHVTYLQDLYFEYFKASNALELSRKG